MIITYEKHERNFGCCVCIPDMLPWKLETIVDHEGYALKLTAGGFEDIILTDEDFLGVVVDIVDEEKEEGEAILALFSQIALSVATTAARVIREGELILNLSEVIEAESEFWLKFYGTSAKGTDDDE